MTHTKTTPQGQIDNGLGTIECPRCGGLNFKGTYMCGHGDCATMMPTESYIQKHDLTGVAGGIDIDRIESGEVESIALTDRYSDTKVKKAAGEKLMDTIDYLAARATNESDAKFYRERRENLGMRFYNRYHNTNFK